MLALVFATIFATLSACANDGARGNEVQWRNYSDALREGKEKQQLIVLDVYTDWCVWCKRMLRDVYGDKDVREYLEANFVVAKLNAESATLHDFEGTKATEREIASAYGINGYPATVFFSEDGEPLIILPGYVEKDKFLNVLRYLNERAYLHQTWDDFLSSRQ